MISSFSPAFHGRPWQTYDSLNFPRIQAVIDGETIDLLFDTGANTRLSDAAMQAIHDGHPAHRATSSSINSFTGGTRSILSGRWSKKQKTALAGP
jgi:hypothetical protein